MTRRLGSGFNLVFKLNQKMVILNRFVTKIKKFHVRIKKTDFEHLQKWKKFNIRSFVWSFVLIV